MLNRYLESILRARVYEVARQTSLDAAPSLSRRLNNTVWLKREDLQPVFSFKLRGAYNKMAQLSPAQRAAGVIAASAGNHAQGVALAARTLGIQALIVMPCTTPGIKVEAVQALGGQTILHGDTYDEAYAQAEHLVQIRGFTLVHPYDDLEVIAGQGTVGMEILRQAPQPPHAIFVPVGGGGLIAGVAAYVKYVYPQVRIIGVEPDDAACLHAAMQAGERVRLAQVGLFADGVAVRQVGKLPFEVAQRAVDEVILVNTDEICAAIRDLFGDTRAIAEPAGALALAGLKRYVARTEAQQQHLVAVVSGANMNFDRLRHVAERASIGEHREALLAVEIPEHPGSFLAFCQALGRRNITEFNYRYADNHRAQVFAGIELTQGDAERHAVVDLLRAQGYAVVDLTENEMAKLHIRYMVGGHAPNAQHEQIYRFEFPERPGALLNFLTQMSGRWNISLFHYRNHGAAYGRVLLGIQVAPGEQDDFSQFLAQLGYAWTAETQNPAYRLFAGGAMG